MPDMPEGDELAIKRWIGHRGNTSTRPKRSNEDALSFVQHPPRLIQERRFLSARSDEAAMPLLQAGSSIGRFSNRQQQAMEFQKDLLPELHN